MFNKMIRWLSISGCIIILTGCSTSFSVPSFLSRLQQGDKQIGWTLSYFDSWKRDRQPRYLKLAENHILTAIDIYASLESHTSPRINEFYVVRDRKARSCRLLSEIQFDAINFGYNLSGQSPEGCTF
ncbi:MAG: hypothetical protein HQM12_05275 [SAR324 cluster bacterium]|nr:hypothetical protein [SAR324 cluster bacterium]